MSTNEVISLTRALAEVKVLEDRILKATNELSLVTVVVGKDNVPVDRNFKTAEDFAAKAQAGLQRITDLSARRGAIKKAITITNSTTLVTIGNREMTISDAVDLKNTLPNRKALLDQMVRNFNDGVARANKANSELDVKVERLVTQLYSGDSKATPDQTKAVRDAQVEQYGTNLANPLDAVVLIKQLRDEIEEVSLNLDFALSEVNAKTELSLVY